MIYTHGNLMSSSKNNIIFKSIKFKNFMSYGNATAEYNFSNGMTLISGSNGFGKSTIFIAVFYALYGKTFKKNKLGSLINNINNKDMFVELSFISNNKEYLIKRGQKPSIFEIYEDGELINQNSTVSSYQEHLETYILKITESAFKQLIFLGANVVGSKTFVDLTKAEKEELFQIITDTSIFSVISDSIKAKGNEAKTKLAEVKFKLDVLAETIESEKNNLKRLEESNAKIESFNGTKVDELKASNIEDTKKIEKYIDVLDKLKSLKVKYDAYVAEITDLSSKNNTYLSKERTLRSELRELLSVRNTFVSCVGCEKLSNISSVDISQGAEDALNAQIEYNTNQAKTVQIQMNELEITAEGYREKLSKGRGLKDSIDLLTKQIQINERDIASISNNVPVEIDYSLVQNKEIELVQLRETFKEVSADMEKLKTLAKLLNNDNLKGVIINQQLPILNKYINEFLQMFSSFDFSFYIDSSFKENIVTKAKDFEFHSLSNGQSMRVLFSIMFAFLKLVEDRNGVSTNLLILDEVLDSSLDFQGRVELLDIIKTSFAKIKNVIIISHNPEIANSDEYFDTNIKIYQEGKFSKILLS